MILSWGKCGIEAAPLNNGTAGEWKQVDTPKKDTTKLTPTAGEEITALEEGGEVVDARYGRNSYTLEFDIFVKKGKELPFPEDDGLVPGEYAIRVTPLEDPTCEGILIDRSVIRGELNYTTADGKWMHYVAKCLKPAKGATVKPYVAENAGE